ncbi:MAG: transcription elongation factor GreA [Ignavibacteriales bacterium]|nr:transcription elongation factor GreA [Ignavibacteriales bacterium]
MTNFVYLTRERLKELENELLHLKTKGRDEVAQRIAEARSYGDLSENAEYDAAKEAQEMLEVKIRRLAEMLSRVRIVEPEKMPKDKVHILSNIKVKNLNNSKLVEYVIVSPEEADFEKNKLAATTPVGQAFIGKAIGDVIEIKVPAGVMKYEIIGIE